MVKFASKQIVKFFQYSLSVHAQPRSALYHPMDFSPPGSSVHGISQKEYWNGLPFPPSWDLPYPGIEPVFPVAPAKQVILYH